MLERWQSRSLSSYHKPYGVALERLLSLLAQSRSDDSINGRLTGKDDDEFDS